MAKKEQGKITLENVELRPQVIGYTYQKKNNIGRVIIIFTIFALVVFYINDISVFINNLLGKNTPETIGNLSGSGNKNEENDNNVENEVVFYTYSNGLEIIEGSIILNNFYFNNNILSFTVVNNGDSSVVLKDKKYYIEIYSDNKTLLERHKLDIDTIGAGKNVSYEYTLKNNFYYIVLEEKTTNDYPPVNLVESESGNATITCTKGIEKIIYNFKNNELTDINHTITSNSTVAEDYYINYTTYQNKTTNYNNLDGITATFNSSLNGFSAVFALDLINVDLSEIEEKYYYGYKEEPKVVKFEMQTYGFNCN